MSASPRPARVWQLDVLRAVAVLLVLGRHRHLNWLWMQVGWVGVDLFFVLSGFLVSGLLFAEYRKYGSLDVRRFLVRRAFKIYPSFYLLLLVTVGYQLATRQQPFRLTLLSEALFVQNYGPALWDHTWSLAVEEHFYLLLALAVFLLCRRAAGRANPFGVLPRAIPAVLGMVLLIRTATALFLPFAAKTHVYPTHLRADALLFGVLLAYGHHFHPERLKEWVRTRKRGLFYASLAAVLPTVLFTQNDLFMATLGVTLVYLGMGGFLLLALHGEATDLEAQPRPLRKVWSTLAGIGVYSYTIYLWHLPLLHWGPEWLRGGKAGPVPDWAAQLLYLAGSLCLGMATGRLIEQPTLALRNRLFPSRGEDIYRRDRLPPERGAESAEKRGEERRRGRLGECKR